MIKFNKVILLGEMNMIFIDSSFLIALANDNDQWHQRAVKILKKVIKHQNIISTIHISETITLIGSISGGKVADEIYQYIKDNYKIIDATIDLLDNSREKYLTYDGTISLADSLAIEIMEKQGIIEIASFDSDFDKIKGIVRIH